MSDKTQTTVVQEATMDLSDILNPDSSAVMVPGEEVAKKPSIFSRNATDLSFLSPGAKTNDEDEGEGEDSNLTPDQKAIKDLAAITLPETDDDDPAKVKGAGGRPTGIVSVGKKLIEKGLIVPFEGETDVSKYTEDDWMELFELNKENQVQEISKEVSDKFFDSLPAQLQQAFTYVMNGGNDLTGLFQELATVNQIRDLNISDEAGQIYAIRTYLQTTNFGTPQEIQDEILAYQDRGDLEKKAKQFKPRLDGMKEQIVQQKLKQQQDAAVLRQKQSQQYAQSVYDVLEKADLNGIPLTSQVQNMLFAGLTQPTYPSMNGKQTSLLGHLLEQHQFVKPNHSLIAEATWLMQDPDGYRKAVRAIAEKEANSTTFRKLKTEQASGQNGSTSPTAKEEKASGIRGIQRSNQNGGGFFKRPS